jgi:hypothetical protein
VSTKPKQSTANPQPPGVGKPTKTDRPARAVPLKTAQPSSKRSKGGGFSTDDAFLVKPESNLPTLKPEENTTHVPSRAGGGLWDEET